ncbi:radical SAM protein [archaeon]|nr:radical SAM protein [archaeon]
MQTNTGEFETANYDFCLFRIPQEGGRVLWQITNVCNYDCSYCIFASGPQKINGELNTEEIIRGINALKNKGFSHIKFTGGEPFVRKDLVEVLEYAANSGLVVDVSTNASLVTKEKAQRLASAGLNMVHVSVDGHIKEIHDGVRGEGTFVRTLNGLQNIVNEGIYVRVGTVIFKQNDSYLRNVVELCLQQGVNEVIFSIMEPAGRIAGDYSSVTQKSAQELADTIDELSLGYIGRIKVHHNFNPNAENSTCSSCPGGKKFLYIDNLGRVSPCTWIVERNPEYRSKLTVREGLDIVLNSSQLQNYLKSIEGTTGCPLRWKK